MTLCYDVFFGQPEVDSCVLKVSVFLWLELAPQVSTTVIICRIECRLNADLCQIRSASFRSFPVKNCGQTGPPKIPLEVILGEIDLISGLFFKPILAFLSGLSPPTSNFQSFIRIIGNSFEKNYITLKNGLQVVRVIFSHHLPHPHQLASCLS